MRIKLFYYRKETKIRKILLMKLMKLNNREINNNKQNHTNWLMIMKRFNN